VSVTTTGWMCPTCEVVMDREGPCWVCGAAELVPYGPWYSRHLMQRLRMRETEPQ